MVQTIGLTAHAPRVPNLRRNIAFCRGPVPQLIAVISTARLSDLLRRSYLLPRAAISGIIALFCGVSRRTLTILLYPRHSVKGISRNLRDFFVQADSPSPAALRRAARSIYNRYGLARRFSFSAFYFPHFLRDFRRFSRIFPEKSAHFRSVTILQVAFPVMLW